MRAQVRLFYATAVLAALPATASAVTAPPGFTATAVVTGLSQPTAAAFAPDGRLFVLEKGGAVRAWTAARGLGAPLITLPSCTESEMGLLGVAVDPAFARTGWLYLYHTQPPGGDVGRCGEGSAAGRQNRVVRVTVTGDRIDAASLVVLRDGMRTDGGNHDGGGLRIGPDGFLYVGVGDTGRGDFGRPGDATNPYARNPDALEGKILRLTLDGAPAPGNPFLGRGGAADFVFASGLRNPFRFAFDARSGLLWVADVGQNTFEEIDVVRSGDDLGWPSCEGMQPVPPCPAGTVPPVHVYPHGADDASITGGVFYEGTQFDAAYRGDYFFGDFVLDVVWRARLDAGRTGFAAAPEEFLRDVAGPVDFTVGPDGALYVVAFKAGEIVRVAQEGASVAPDACARTVTGIAPRLLRIAGRRPAACLDACPAPRLSQAERRRLGRVCGTPPPAVACARLACPACDTAADLGACLASVSGAGVADVLDRFGSQDGRCAGAARRAAVRTATSRLRAIAACAQAGGLDCVGGARPSRVPALGRACRTPPPALCAALACTPCTGAAELAACLATAVAPPVDALAHTLLGR